jgi:hypothetical protein
MSMNLHVRGSREVTVNATGATSFQYIKFNLWSTPTNVTNAILSSDNHIQAYRDWVASNRYEYEEFVYAENDPWEFFEPIGTKTVCSADEHLQELDKFIKKCQQECYKLEFFDL